MHVCWKQCRSTARWHKRKPPVLRIKAVLLYSMRINGEPRQLYVTHIASYRPGAHNSVGTRVVFWHGARQRLDQISDRLT